MFQHILVPLDGSRLAEAALPPALQLASKFDGKITLVRVAQPPHLVLANGGGAYADLLIDLREQADEEAEEYLRAHQGSLRQQGYRIDIRVAAGEPVAEIILEIGDGIDADTIVMSTHGRGGLSRWVYGSVADKVLRHARVPVLLIRAKEE